VTINYYRKELPFLYKLIRGNNAGRTLPDIRLEGSGYLQKRREYKPSAASHLKQPTRVSVGVD